jgi:hypothetical protein
VSNDDSHIQEESLSIFIKNDLETPIFELAGLSKLSSHEKSQSESSSGSLPKDLTRHRANFRKMSTFAPRENPFLPVHGKKNQVKPIIPDRKAKDSTKKDSCHSD